MVRHENHQQEQHQQEPHERLVLTTVVEEAQWRADDRAVLADVRATLHQRAAQRGLLVQGQPVQDVEIMAGDHRVRITLTATAKPTPPSPRAS